MSTTYIALDDADIVAGKPTKEELFVRIKANQDCFNADIEQLKQTAVIQIFNIKFGGSITQYTEAEIIDRIPTWRAPVGGTVNQIIMTLLSPSTSGVLQMQIEKSSDNGINWSTMLTTPVEITGTQIGDTSGVVSFSTQAFNQSDLIRMRLVGAQVEQGEFHVEITGELA